eukprot:snap_masked-scaffold_1-processed-gene-31.14-mRNA-1 protein AED:0.29 eAED:0.29 QI:0/0/0/1/1/1/2/0/218
MELTQKIRTTFCEKIVATYCSSGSTACPSASLIHLRAGWLLRDVQNPHPRYEAVGDQYLRRIVNGLPLDNHLFAVLTPHFRKSEDYLAHTVREILPRLDEHLALIGETCLASLVCHHNFLQRNLDSKHTLRGSLLFTDSSLPQKLEENLNSPNAITSEVVTITGIPPHVAVTRRTSKVTERLKANVAAIEASSNTVIEHMRRSTQSGHAKSQGLNQGI